MPIVASDRPCKYGHAEGRWERNRECIVCRRARINKDSSARYYADKSAASAYRREHYLKNAEAYKDRAKERNKRTYIPSPPEGKTKRPGYWAEAVGRYRAAKKRATPKWADRDALRAFYAACPDGFEVDHIYPLAGELVCGLHVIENLQYLTRSENASKGNRYAP